MSIHPDQIERGGDYLNKGVKYSRTDLIPAMIQAAVDAEREACALVAQRQHNVWQSQGNACLVDDDVSACANIAAAIRARKGGE